MKSGDIHIRDPFVLVDEGTYYLYGTRGATCWGKADGFDVFIGKDLENWEGPFEVFHRGEDFWADEHYWAPEVHRYGGAFYLFASFKKEGVCRGTQILRASSPMGPFVPYSDGPLTPRDWECLDGTLYVSAAGKPYMVFCHEWLQVHDGEIWALPLSDDLKTTAGEPFLLLRASEQPGVRSADGVNYVTDGPFLHRMQDGSLVMIWATHGPHGYCEVVAVSDNGEIDGHWRMSPDPLFQEDGGHGMLFRDLGGQLYIVLHTPNKTPFERPCFYRLREKEGGFVMEGTPRALWGTFAEDRPRLEKQFEEHHWNENSGLPPEKLYEGCLKIAQAEADRPRMLTKAHIFRYIIENGRIEVEPLDWFADQIDHGGCTARIRTVWEKALTEGVLKEPLAEFAPTRDSFACFGEADYGHTSPDWTAIMALGLPGLLARIRESRASHAALTEEQRDFYDAAETVYLAAIHLARRLSAEAARLSDRYAKMKEVSLSLAHLAEGAPGTMLEALQLSCLWYTLQHELDAVWLRSLGGLDRLLYPFYRRDLESGRYTEEQLRELIRYFFIRCYAKKATANTPFYLGGRDRNGADTLNALSYVLVEEYRKLDIHDPKMHIRYHPRIAPDFLTLVLSCIREGKNSFVLINDEVAEQALIKLGEAPEHANDYVPVGCYECAALGKEVPCSVNGRLNLAKVLEIAIHDGYDPVHRLAVAPPGGCGGKWDTFEAFYTYYKQLIAFFANGAMKIINAYERQYPALIPAPLFSGTMAECVERGKDAYAGGALYNNSSINAFGIATVVDSLVALRKVVYEEKRMDIGRFREILDSDWAGQEMLRLHIRNNYPKYGNGQPEADGFMTDLVDHVAAQINGKPNGRHGVYRCGFFSIDWRMVFGKHTGATPDGRLSGEPLSKNMGAVTAQDKEGVTALINSVTKVDYTEIPNGSVLDLVLHASAVQGREGLAAMVALARTYFRQGGFGLHINVLDPAVLKEAQADPAQYANLQVRLCGWNVHFIDLSKEEQDDFIRQSEHAAG